MDKLFNPESIAILGLSSKSSNIPRLVLENLIRWGYKGRIFGINPTSEDLHVNGIKMYKKIDELPIVPDLVVALIPARFIPQAVEECGKFGVKRMSIPSGGFNEMGEEGQSITQQLIDTAKKYNIRFVGPNGVTVANTYNGLCLPFVPSYSPPKGGLSIITQSGGVGIMLWNLMTDENVGMAKFASIGNKLDLDEVDFLEYFGQDPETKIIGMYLESVPRGRRFVEAISKINKPVIILKSNVSEAGHKLAMSHTAALSNDDDILSTAFERAGVLRVRSFTDLISVAKAFKLPPMQGKRMMVMSPAGGFAVLMADLCEKVGFQFADPGEEFYDGLKKFSNAGIIKFSNPLDMGDIYDPKMTAHIFYQIMHNENVDGAVYLTQWPHMPKGEDVFTKMFQTDLSKESIGTLLSSGKPMGACVFGLSSTTSQMKHNINFPLWDSPDEMIYALKKQSDYYENKNKGEFKVRVFDDIDREGADKWLKEHDGDVGEEALELLEYYGIKTAKSSVAKDEKEAVEIAQKIGYPVVMKVVSPDALHKTEAGGVLVDIKNDEEAKASFNKIKENLMNYKKDARFEGVRVMTRVGDGYDMFVGGKYDDSFGPVVFFGYGGIYVEVFKDVKNVICPSNYEEIEQKVEKLKSTKIVKGIRGKGPGNIPEYIEFIERLSHLMNDFQEIKELDVNPMRILEDGSSVVALDARIRIVR